MSIYILNLHLVRIGFNFHISQSLENIILANRKSSDYTLIYMVKPWSLLRLFGLETRYGLVSLHTLKEIQRISKVMKAPAFIDPSLADIKKELHSYV